MEDDDEEIPEDGHVDDLGQVLQVEHSDCGNDKEKAMLCWGYPKNSDNNPNTSRVLNTFKYKIRAQRDCESLCK
jgi:hypothetical protein